MNGDKSMLGLSKPKLGFLLGLFLICMCTLMLQIIQTRILSVISYYHLAFFSISIAMFGMTAGSLFAYFKERWFPSEHSTAPSLGHCMTQHRHREFIASSKPSSAPCRPAISSIAFLDNYAAHKHPKCAPGGASDAASSNPLPISSTLMQRL
jgi:hypothetical protein